MSVQASRFDFLTDETNVAIADFQSSTNSGTLNSNISTLSKISDSLTGFISDAGSSLLSSGDILKTDATAVLNKVGSRIGKGLGTEIVDLVNISPKDITDKIKSLTGNNVMVSAILDRLPTQCKSKALGKRSVDNSFGGFSLCNGRKRNGSSNCSGSSKDFGEGINLLSGGKFNFSYTDLKGMFDMLTSLSLGGFNMNMCGVFNSLTSAFGIGDGNLLSKASGFILNELTSMGDVTGILDMATSSAGLAVKSVLPDVAGKVLDSFGMPSELAEVDLSSMYDRVSGALDIFDGDWKTSPIDNGLKLVSDNTNLSDIFQSKAMDAVVSSSDMFTAPTTDEVFLLSAIA